MVGRKLNYKIELFIHDKSHQWHDIISKDQSIALASTLSE